MGRGVPSSVRQSSVLYNEYIAYNTEQVTKKYLLLFFSSRLKFFPNKNQIE